MSNIDRYGPLVGRILMAFIFLFAGFGKITGFEGTVGYIASKGLPLPQVAALAAVAVEVGGGILLVIGWKTRWAAAALMLFAGLTAVIFHDFWAVSAGQAQNQMIHFMKNIAMMGGLLFVVVHGGGPISVEARHRAGHAAAVLNPEQIKGRM